MAEEEVLVEIEAVKAVYGDDCVVLHNFPPHLHVHIKPRTADVSSQQFVEAVLAIQAGPQYPIEPPHIVLMETKGLDERRQKLLITSIQDKACELSSCLMLVTLCEEAVERLSIMNHPDGDCPLCLYPLVLEDEQNNFLPFMKLMSCFHCFHSECIIRWWNWLQTEKESYLGVSSSATVYLSRDVENEQGTTTTSIPFAITSTPPVFASQPQLWKQFYHSLPLPPWLADMHGTMKERMGNCPVCRKSFHAKDFEHVLDLVGTHSSHLGLHGTEATEDEKLLQSDSENIRRLKFDTILKLQQENSGLIEPPKNLVVLPGMFLPQPVTSTTTTSTKETTEQQQRDPAVVASETNSSSSSGRPSTSERRYSDMRRQRVRNFRKPVKQWVKKESGTAD